MIPAPYVNCADKQVDVGIFAALLGEGFEFSDFLRVIAVAFAHHNVAAAVKENIADFPHVSEFALLGFPQRRDGKNPVLSRDANHRVVRGFENRHFAVFAIGGAEETHADSVAAVCDEIKFGNCRIRDRIGDAFVHRNDEIRVCRRDERLRERERRIHFTVAGNRDGKFGLLRFEMHICNKLFSASYIEQFDVHFSVRSFCTGDDEIVIQLFLRPRLSGPFVSDGENRVAGLERNTNRAVFDFQFAGDVAAHRFDAAFALQTEAFRPDRRRTEAGQTRKYCCDPVRYDEPGADKLPSLRIVDDFDSVGPLHDAIFFVACCHAEFGVPGTGDFNPCTQLENIAFFHFELLRRVANSDRVHRDARSASSVFHRGEFSHPLRNFHRPHRATRTTPTSIRGYRACPRMKYRRGKMRGLLRGSERMRKSTCWSVSLMVFPE